jgi:hypothetical protein
MLSPFESSVSVIHGKTPSRLCLLPDNDFASPHVRCPEVLAQISKLTRNKILPRLFDSRKFLVVSIKSLGARRIYGMSRIVLRIFSSIDINPQS